LPCLGLRNTDCFPTGNDADGNRFGVEVIPIDVRADIFDFAGLFVVDPRGLSNLAIAFRVVTRGRTVSGGRIT